MLILIVKTKNRPPKNIKSTPFRVKVKSYFKHMNVKKLASGGRNKILYKKNGVELFILFTISYLSTHSQYCFLKVERLISMSKPHIFSSSILSVRFLSYVFPSLCFVTHINVSLASTGLEDFKAYL